MPRILVHRGATLRERLEHIGWTVTAAGCWEWNGARDSRRGYGQCSTGDKRRHSDLAHRLSFRAFKGDIPAGMFVCHRCDNPPCINPDHLFIGTPSDNRQDMLTKGRGNFARGERHGQSVLSDAQVANVRFEYARGGVSYQALATQFGVSKSCISLLVRGKSRS